MCFVYFENKKPEADENQQATPRCGCELNLFERIILPATETKLWNLLLSPRCIPCDHFRFLLVNNTECIFFLLLFYMREGVQFVCFSVVDEEKWWWFVISNVLFFHSHTSVCNFQDNKSKKKIKWKAKRKLALSSFGLMASCFGGGKRKENGRIIKLVQSVNHVHSHIHTPAYTHYKRRVLATGKRNQSIRVLSKENRKCEFFFLLNSPPTTNRK